MDDEARARAEQRRRQASHWRVRVYALGDEPALDPDDPTTIDERLAAMWPLAVEMWRLGGRELPTYERSRAPGAVFRRDGS